MEDTLRVLKNIATKVTPCLNPCFNGRYSQRNNKNMKKIEAAVLILVLMEDTLRGFVAQEDGTYKS